MDVITEGKKIQNELVELRRYFHEHPELPWEEFNTQKKIMEYLDELGIPYQVEIERKSRTPRRKVP